MSKTFQSSLDQPPTKETFEAARTYMLDDRHDFFVRSCYWAKWGDTFLALRKEIEDEAKAKPGYERTEP